MRAITLGLLALAAAGACGGNDTPATAGATVPLEAPSTTASDPYAVPAKIDAAYLNRIFAALEKVDGDATRAIVASRKLPPDATDRLRAIYADPEFQKQVDLWLDVVVEGVTGFNSEPGDRRTAIERVVTARSDCVFVAVKRDYTPVTGSVGAGRTNYVALRPLDSQRDQLNLNPTPWAIAFDGYNTDGSQPEDPCVT